MSTLKEIQDIINKSEEGADKLVELNLSDVKIGTFTADIKKTIEKCKNLQILILSGCGLTSLDNMPESDLTAVDLTSNNLTDSELAKLARYQNLGQIIFNENNVTKLESIKVLSKLENLQQLDLSDNPVTKQQNYKDYVFQNLPKLQVLDRFDREGNEQVEQEQFQDDQDDDEDDEQFDDEDDDDQQFDEDEEDSPKPAKKR